MRINVREKRKGSGVYYLFLTDAGERKALAIGSKEQAETLQVELYAQYITGGLDISRIPKPGQTMRKASTLAEYAAEWINKADWLKPQTIKGYKSIITRHIAPSPIGAMPVNTVDQKAVKEFLSALRASGISHARTLRIKATLSSVLSSVAQDDDFPGFINPVPGLRVHKDHSVQTSVPEPLSAKELDLYLRTMRTEKTEYYPLFFLLARTGLRIGEAIALSWEDVNPEDRQIRVRRSWGNGRYTTPKSGRSRIVPVTPELHDILKVLKASHMLLDPRQELVFPGKTGKPLSASNLYSRVHKPVLAKAGLRHIRIHDLRHTYATLRLRLGHALVDVSKALGHADTGITSRIYYHAVPRTDDVEILDRLVTSQPKA